MDYSSLGSSVHGILQARIWEWVSIPFFMRSSPPRNWTLVSCIAGRLFTIWAIKEVEKAMAPHSSALAWEIPWTEEPGRLQFMGWQRVGHNWVTSLSLFTFMHWRRKWQPTQVLLPGESQGWESGGLPSMGSHRVGHDWRDLAAAASGKPTFGEWCSIYPFIFVTQVYSYFLFLFIFTFL